MRNSKSFGTWIWFTVRFCFVCFLVTTGRSNTISNHMQNSDLFIVSDSILIGRG